MPAAGDDTSLCGRAISTLEHSWLFHTHVLTAWISDKVMIQREWEVFGVFFLGSCLFPWHASQISAVGV